MKRLGTPILSSLLAAGLLIVLPSCASGGTWYEVRLELKVTIPGSAPAFSSNGRIHVELHHATQGEGYLKHPLGLVDSFQMTADGTYIPDEEASRTSAAGRSVQGEVSIPYLFHYPLEQGKGLYVYVWADADGDGALCTPSVRTELAGGTEVKDFPAHVVPVTVVLNAACTGAEGLYPP